MSDLSLFDGATVAPLAARMRPTTIEQVVGKEDVLGDGGPLGEMLRRGEIRSMILWGPPGSGKTTIARLLSTYTDQHLVHFSAVGGRVAEVREILRDAEQRRRLEGRGTILFCDEVHRFNKAQQDAFLAAVEDGTITLVGATTENPSFELNSALLSRMAVFVLAHLDERAMEEICSRAMSEGIGDPGFGITDEAQQFLFAHAAGDARRLLNALEAAYAHWRGVGSPTPLDAPTLAAVLQRSAPRYDKAGEQHYDITSALHKSIRGSDVDATLYWLARMVEGGENLRYVARRLVRMSIEDIGLADPRALTVTIAARDAYEFLGSPEGDLALAEAAAYLASAPKSNSVYRAFGSALEAARAHPNEPVPLHIRNAPTKLMRDLGYGAGYAYAHDHEGGYVEQEYLPSSLRGVTWYEPTDRGYEREIRARLDEWRTRIEAGDRDP